MPGHPTLSASADALFEWLAAASDKHASDLHIIAHAPPCARIHGQLVQLADVPLTLEDCTRMVYAIMTAEQRACYERLGEVDFSLNRAGVSRYRVQVYRQRGTPSLAARMIPSRVPTFAETGLPSQVADCTESSNGLFLVTGPAGSGKSTTLAALVDIINRRDAKHIVTLEDPIEFIHKHDRCLIEQREIGVDTQSFERGLRSALRQAPDVILVGELRDLETMSTAITAAETGHLVFATLHTSNAVQTIDRIVDVFPSDQQTQVRIQLADVLLGVLSQQLLPAADGQSLVLACELLINTPAIANLIRTHQVHQIRSAMQTGRSHGMLTMDASLRALTANGKIAR